MSEARNLDPTILREYDIRGIVDDTLGAADVRAIGRAFGTMVVGEGGRTVAVGYDGRLSSLFTSIPRSRNVQCGRSWRTLRQTPSMYGK